MWLRRITMRLGLLLLALLLPFWLGAALILPSVGVQAGINRLARTDLAAQIAYQDRIRAFHVALRRFNYPNIFKGTPFRAADFAKAPRWPEYSHKSAPMLAQR